MMRLSDICPVCGMKAEAGVSSVEHLKMYFHFCSEQCRETFVAHPSLYRSKVGNERSEIIKRRTMRLIEALNNETTELLISHLTEMMGLKEVVVEGGKVHITYDLLQVTESQIEKALREVGLQLGGAWRDRLHRAWVHNSEEIELDNLAAPPAPLPNRAPPGA